VVEVHLQELAEAEGARLPPAAASRPDWHNARSRLILDLGAKLDALPDDASREALLKSLSQALEVRSALLDTDQGGRAPPAAA